MSDNDNRKALINHLNQQCKEAHATITRLESRLAAAEKVIEADETILTGDVNFTYENRVPVLEQHDAYWRQYNPAKIGEGPDAARETA